MSINTITAEPVPENQRLDLADHLFGIRYPLQLEPTIYQFAVQLAETYSGAYWHFHRLSNGGFMMTPNLDLEFHITAENGFKGTMSAEALGITACLYAYSNLSFAEGAFGKTCADHYHWLYDFAMLHPEAAAIRTAID